MKHRFLSILSLPLILLTLCGPAPAACAEASGTSLSLVAINVGKADCLLLRSGASCYMVDTGTAESWGAVSAALRQYGITRLDGVILTHTHKDHAGGIMALAQSGLKIDGWYASAYFAEVKEKKHPAVLASALRGEKVTWLKGGDTLPLDGGSLRVLGPLRESDTENCNSVVLLAETADGSVLLTGDMEYPEEEDLLAAGLLGHTDVLKVGNHAESDATSHAFVQAVSPRVAVISTDSVAEPDTPARRVLQALDAVGAQIARTERTEVAVEAELKSGEVTVYGVSRGSWPAAQTGIVLGKKDVKADTITLRNTGSETVDLSGWFIRSDRGREIFVFPEGASIASGAEQTVAAQDSAVLGDYLWPEEKVWHKSKDDQALLCDAWGRLISTLD